MDKYLVKHMAGFFRFGSTSFRALNSPYVDDSLISSIDLLSMKNVRQTCIPPCFLIILFCGYNRRILRLDHDQDFSFFVAFVTRKVSRHDL